MKNYAISVLAIFIGFSMLTLSIAYYENSKSAQKIENIEKLYGLKTTLQQNKDRREIQDLVDSTQIMIDSLNNIN